MDHHPPDVINFRPLITIRYTGSAVLSFLFFLLMEWMSFGIDYGGNPKAGIIVTQLMLCLPCLLLIVYFATSRVDVMENYLRIMQWGRIQRVPYSDVAGMEYGGKSASESLTIHYNNRKGKSRSFSIYKGNTRKSNDRVDYIAGLLQRHGVPSTYGASEKKHIKQSVEKPGYHELKARGIAGIGWGWLIFFGFGFVWLVVDAILQASATMKELGLIGVYLLMMIPGIWMTIYGRNGRVWIGPEDIIWRGAFKKEKMVLYSDITHVQWRWEHSENSGRVKNMVLYNGTKNIYEYKEQQDGYLFFLDTLRAYSKKHGDRISGLYD